MTPYTPDLDLSPLPTKCCAACIFFGYPAANVDRHYGQCRYDAPKSGSQGADRWPVMSFDESCGAFEPGTFTAVYRVGDGDLHAVRSPILSSRRQHKAPEVPIG